MKDMALDNTFTVEGIYSVKEDRFELVLAENERILNRVNERLERIDLIQEKLKIYIKNLRVCLYFQNGKRKE